MTLKIKRLGVWLLLLPIALTVFATDPIIRRASAQAFDQYSGEETFERFCASCHGVEGTGNGPVAAGLPITVPDLTTLRERQGESYREETLRRIIDGRSVVIYHGTRYMPVWGYEFWVEEGADREAEERVEIIISNLLDYIASIQR